MRAKFKGLVDLNAFEFVDIVPDDVNVASARWVLPGRQAYMAVGVMECTIIYHAFK